MEQVEFTDHNALKLQLKPPHFKRSYGVLYTYTSGSKEDTVKFNLDVTYVKTIIDRSRIFRLERDVVYVNDIEPDLLADQLAYECGKVFYPLLVEVDFSGKYLGVYNHPEIISRWKVQRPVIQEYFKGETTERYLILMDKAIASVEQVNMIFYRELFISSFFSSLYQSYGEHFETGQTCYFPIVGMADPVQFNVVQIIDPILNEAHMVQLVHRGTLTDERSARDLKEEQSYALSKFSYPDEPSATGRYHALYRLDAETKAIVSLVADWELDLEPIQKTQVKVFERVKSSEGEKAPLIEETKEPVMIILDGKYEKKERKITDIFNFLLGK
nr:hypothetical protein [Pedobacter sp. ASV19]